jgi:hypothetical protein
MDTLVQAMVFWVVTKCGEMYLFGRFGGRCHFYLQCDLSFVQLDP